MPNRILRDWTDSDPVNTLSADAERLFVRLIMKVDDFGRYIADPRLLRPSMYPLLLDQVREATVSRWLAECEKAGLVRRYAVDDKQYLEVQNFRQRTRSTESKYPSPPWFDGHAPVTRPSLARHSRAYTETKADTDTDTKALPPNPPTGGADFDSWWDAYPHKVGKKAARKAYSVARKQADAATLLAGVAAYVSSKPQDRQWCNPATWLNQGRWEDQPAVPGRARPATGLGALSPSQIRSLHRFACGRHPEIVGLPTAQDTVRRAMKRCLGDWKDSK